MCVYIILQFSENLCRFVYECCKKIREIDVRFVSGNKTALLFNSLCVPLFLWQSSPISNLIKFKGMPLKLFTDFCWKI